MAIIAATFHGNRGAEAMLSTTIGVLADRCGPQMRFEVFSYYPEADRELVSDARVRIFSSTPAYLVLVLVPGALLHRLLGGLRLHRLQGLLPASVRALARSRALLCLAGVSFIDGRAKFLPFNIATIWPAMILRVPVVKMSQAMGPFRSWPNRPLANLFLGRCHRLHTRGAVSQDHVASLLGPRGNYGRSDDVAFLFEARFCLSTPAPGLDGHLAALQVLRDRGRPIIGLCPSAVIARRAAEGGHDYPGWMAGLIDELVGLGHGVALFPNATRGRGETRLHNNDLPLLRGILTRLEPAVAEAVVGFEEGWNAGQIHRILGACDVHAVSRFHAMVGALVVGVPVLVMGWSHKYLEVMERFGQADMVFDGADLDRPRTVALIQQLLTERADRRVRIVAALPDVKALASLQFDAVQDLLAL
ncbi:polysaccharide pyruvyl transferase family protein [Synechococcus sp. CS-1332]|uniref:polysaccharide pyruvyl transferase family protein n=1 Tax=Synechococcus sp. CS-1332 TaxID=2847972 RepID=UPI00223A818A|nr:polysaccharide pyruvyl transferase family protein [Synechococcus sp. CS-1332]MCT0208564.1 polysaccharide pyruvyl transferase family protein [Synechococcus sp. CS-1332]